MQLDGNTVLITGGATGIGFSLAQALVQRGNTVIICSRRQDKLEAARKRIPQLHIRQCDVTDPADCRALFDNVAEHFPLLNVLVNNAGTGGAASFREQPDMAKIRNTLATNLQAPIELTALFMPLLKRQAHSAVVNVSSALAYVPIAGTAVYCATKSALHAFTWALRPDLEQAGIRVFEVLPPAVDTEMIKDYKGPKLTPDHTARKIMEGLAKDRYVIRIGQAKLLYWLSRIAPDLIFYLINRSVRKGKEK